MRGRRVCWPLRAAFLSVALLGVAGGGPVRAVEVVPASECWRNALAGTHAEDGLARGVVRFRFAGRSFTIPAPYLQGGLPRAALGTEDAVRLFASPPNLAPLTPEEASVFWQPGSGGVRITIFGHPHFLHGQALIDAMTRGYLHENRNGERDAHGFLVLRPTLPGAALSLWYEIHVWPGDPERMFHCSSSDDPRIRSPRCVLERWIGGPLRVEMSFSKALLPDYPALEAALERAMTCTLDPAETPEHAWPAGPPAAR